MVVRESTGKFVTQRQIPKLCKVCVSARPSLCCAASAGEKLQQPQRQAALPRAMEHTLNPSSAPSPVPVAAAGHLHLHLPTNWCTRACFTIILTAFCV
jgi:hypothetical protein